MRINLAPADVEKSSHRLEAFLREKGRAIAHTGALELSVRLLGFESLESYRAQHGRPLSPFDQDLSEAELVAETVCRWTFWTAKVTARSPTNSSTGWIRPVRGKTFFPNKKASTFSVVSRVSGSPNGGQRPNFASGHLWAEFIRIIDLSARLERRLRDRDRPVPVCKEKHCHEQATDEEEVTTYHSGFELE